ncbi:unnamed protein product [Closterium sp. Naga37s-1]|nr:unnamed protein product [Closterium sp. Naga37s-1]
MALPRGLRLGGASVKLHSERPGLSVAATLALVALLAAFLLPAAHARKDSLSSADDSSAVLPTSASADAAISAADAAPRDVPPQRQGPRILNVESYNADEPLPEHLKDMEVHRRELQWNGRRAENCGRTTLRIAQKYVGVWYQKNYIFNMTLVNTCKYSLLSPLILFNCFDFGNLMVGSLDNPARYPSRFQNGPQG